MEIDVILEFPKRFAEDDVRKWDLL